MSMKGQSSMTGMDIKPDAQGKVRDLYDLGDKLLLVASDRISAFDYILEDEDVYKRQRHELIGAFSRYIQD